MGEWVKRYGNKNFSTTHFKLSSNEFLEKLCVAEAVDLAQTLKTLEGNFYVCLHFWSLCFTFLLLKSGNATSVKESD